MGWEVPEYEPVMKELLRTAVRMFYESHHVVIVDILLEAMLLSDVEFCERMKLLNREFNRFIVRLKDDRIIRQDVKVENLENNRQNIRTVFFFNFPEARSVIKYKIYRMTKSLENTTGNSEGMFYCEDCSHKFTPLEAQANMDGFVFKCRFCDSELTEYAGESEKAVISLQELISDLEPLIALLKKAEEFQIPTMDYFQVLELKKTRDAAIEEQAPVATKQEVEEEGAMEEVVKDDEDYESGEAVRIELKEEEKEDEEVLLVKGQKKKFSEITEEDLEEMDEEEYTRYFEIYSSKNE